MSRVVAAGTMPNRPLPAFTSPGDRERPAATQFRPVREARRLWGRTFSEQLNLHDADLAPWLIEHDGPVRTLPGVYADGAR